MGVSSALSLAAGSDCRMTIIAQHMQMSSLVLKNTVFSVGGICKQALQHRTARPRGLSYWIVHYGECSCKAYRSAPCRQDTGISLRSFNGGVNKGPFGHTHFPINVSAILSPRRRRAIWWCWASRSLAHLLHEFHITNNIRKSLCGRRSEMGGAEMACFPDIIDESVNEFLMTGISE